jgi:uncharacterized protein
MRKVNSQEKTREKARAVINKPAAAGEDIDLNQYITPEKDLPYQSDPSQLSGLDKAQMLSAGVMLDDPSQRSGTFLQMDNTPVHFSAKQDGVEVMATSQALQKYDWLQEYWWKAVDVDTDKYTASVELNQGDGYFIRALPGQKSIYPIQACLYIAKKQAVQNVHNIVIAEENSELHIITGCAVAPRNDPALHLGVSEFFIKKGARVI